MAALLLIAPLALAALVQGCIQAPELDDALTEDAHDADYPILQPLRPEDFAGPTPAEAQADIQAPLDSRVSSLQTRANALRRPVVDDATRKRLEDGIPNPTSGDG